LHIPVTIGLLDAQGQDMVLYLNGRRRPHTSCVLDLTDTTQTFRFHNVKQRPVPSLLRNFSAPVALDYEYSDSELIHLMAHDSDPFNRWEAGQRLSMRRLQALIADVLVGGTLAVDEVYVEALRGILTDDTLTPAFRELMLILPTEAVLAEHSTIIAPQAIHQARMFMRRTLATSLKADLIATYEKNLISGDYSPDAISAGKRALKNLCLSYLLEWEDESTVQLALAQEHCADNMTDRQAALVALLQRDPATPALQRYYKDYADEALVVDKWFSMQATSHHSDVSTIRKLMNHPAFTLKNPNRARSLIFSFCNGNPARFHAQDGSGYAYWVEQVIALNAINPQVAARLARSLDHWRRYQPALRSQMHAALRKVADHGSLAKDVGEIVNKALGK
jgi:aminopeptidase N